MTHQKNYEYVKKWRALNRDKIYGNSKTVFCQKKQLQTSG